MPADVFAVLTSPIAPLPGTPATSLPPAQPPFPTVAGHALRSLVPPVPKSSVPKPFVPRPAHSLQNRAYVCVKISEKRRAELIARGVYDAFRDDEDAQFRALAPRKLYQHYAAGSTRVMVRNVPLVLARPEELPERFIERPGPALLEPYASVLKEDRLVNTLGEYRCRWKGCGAVLGSEARLKRHVAKRAHAAQGAVAAERTVYRCFWAGCEGPCFERVEGLIQHLAARHVAGRLRCPFEECEMTSPTLAHLQRHAIRQHAPDAPLRPRADLPILPSLPALPPLPVIAHADELCTHRVAGRQHASAYRQELVRARIQRLCFGGPEPDTEAGGVTMMEQLALTPQPDALPQQRKRKRMNRGWNRKKQHPSLLKVKAEPASDVDSLPPIGAAERNWAARQEAARREKERERERYERKRLGRVWVEIPVRSKRKEGIYERPETPPPPPVTPGSAVEKREKREKKRARESEGRAGPADAESSSKKRRTEYDTSVFDSFRRSSGALPAAAASASSARTAEDADSEAEVEASFDPTPVSSTPARSTPNLTSNLPASAQSARSVRSGSSRATRTPNGLPVTPARPSASPVTSTGGRKIPRHSVEVVLPRQSPMVIR